MSEAIVIVGGIVVFCWMLGAAFVIIRGIFRKIFRPAKKLSDYKKTAATVAVVCLLVGSSVSAEDFAFVGFSTAAFSGTAGLFEMADGCGDTFPGEQVRVCREDEVANTSNPPDLDLSTLGWVRPEMIRSETCSGWTLNTISTNGKAISGAGTFVDVSCVDAILVACCAELRPPYPNDANQGGM